MWAYFEGASFGVGGAANPDGTVGADLPETGPSLGVDGGGATRRAGHLPLVVVIDGEVVAGELIFAQTRVTVLGKGFDSGVMAGGFDRACIHVCVRRVLYCCGWCESRPERRVCDAY